MSESQSIAARGTQLLKTRLLKEGREVCDSDNKTFDLRVDGRYAEVKCTAQLYAKLGFIELTENQYSAVEQGLDFSVFLVCNVNDPEHAEVFEIPAGKLQRQAPKVEKTFYWHKSQLDKILTE